LAAVGLLLLVPPLAGAQTSTKPLVFTGSSTIFPLMTEIVRRFEGLNPGRIDRGSFGRLRQRASPTCARGVRHRDGVPAIGR